MEIRLYDFGTFRIALQLDHFFFFPTLRCPKYIFLEIRFPYKYVEMDQDQFYFYQTNLTNALIHYFFSLK